MKFVPRHDCVDYLNSKNEPPKKCINKGNKKFSKSDIKNNTSLDINSSKNITYISKYTNKIIFQTINKNNIIKDINVKKDNNNKISIS